MSTDDIRKHIKEIGQQIRETEERIAQLAEQKDSISLEIVRLIEEAAKTRSRLNDLLEMALKEGKIDD